METEQNSENIKKIVTQKYGEISEVGGEQLFCGVVGGCCTIAGDDLIKQFADDYSNVEGYNKDADLNLGCGIPTEFACIKLGDTVVDLGSGAGNDCFVARAKTGNAGHVIGIDLTPDMIRKAQLNCDRKGFNNIEFRYGDIEDIPVLENKADVVISNCVINLAPNKFKVFQEIFRILKPFGTFAISDVVLTQPLPEKLAKDSDMLTGCISGAQIREDYIAGIEKAGFENVEIKKTKEIVLSDATLTSLKMTEQEIKDYRNSGCKVLSITLIAQKPNVLSPSKTVEKKSAAATGQDQKVDQNQNSCCSGKKNCC